MTVSALDGGGGDHDDAPGRGRHQGGLEDVGAGLATLRSPPADDADLEVQLPAAAPDPDQRGADLDDVTRPDRGLELHVRVGGEQPLVTVGDDAHLGGDVAERGKGVGAVHEVARVVRVAVGDVATVRHGAPHRGAGAGGGGHAVFSFVEVLVRAGARAWTR